MNRNGSDSAIRKRGEFLAHGRVVILTPNHPYPNYCKKYVYRYRLVMEKHLKRYLNPDEHVHHINDDPMDDRIENLEVMKIGSHVSLHNKLRMKFVKRDTAGRFLKTK